MTCFHNRESMYPPKGISFPIKDRNFLLHSREGYCGQLDQLTALQQANGLYESREATKAQLMPYWCAMRPELCDKDAPKKSAGKKISASGGKAVDALKKKRGGCSSCGGGRVR